MITANDAVLACFLSAGFSTVFVGLRLYARFALRRHPGWDDLMVVLSLLFAFALCPTYLRQVEYGWGKHMNEIPLPTLSLQTYWFWTCTWIYLLGVAFAKLAILVQYLRVFVGKCTRVASWATIVFIVTCCLVCLFGGIFACTPIEKFWNPSLPGTCINFLIIWYLHAAMATSTDFAIVLIPIPTIINVNMESRKKWSLAFTFALGGFGCVTSIVRLYYLHYLNTIQDKTFYYPIGGTWSAIELNVVIICACLITLHPLLAIVLSPIKRYASQYSQRSRNTTGIAPASEVHRHTSKDIKTTIHVMEEGESAEHLASEDSHVIKVSTTIDMRTDRESISESQRSLRGARSENDFRGGMWQDSLEMHPIAQSM
ncbi:integral membrane protein [Botryosphaeria dothidea]|uniref:Integral membrane protein n=1 Tax=Botryosphaeria dothidea TaxID=55169 RepID=A0A8H4J9I8_9PEZI|nr:integral membrane protein [Botryosphaeria dothidea]